MGYYADVIGADFSIHKSKLEEANRIAVDLVKQRKDASYVWYPSECEGVLDLFQHLGFDMQDGEYVTLASYSNKYNEEFDEHIFPAFVPVLDTVDGTPYVEWRGEDGELWRWTPEGLEPGYVTFVKAPIVIPDEYRVVDSEDWKIDDEVTTTYGSMKQALHDAYVKGVTAGRTNQ